MTISKYVPRLYSNLFGSWMCVYPQVAAINQDGCPVSLRDIIYKKMTGQEIFSRGYLEK